jgi:hypothetical protein
MNRSIPICLFFLATTFSPNIGRGSVIYTYEGEAFSVLVGGGYFVVGDRVTGIVQFATAPAPNSIFEGGAIEAFELSDVTLPARLARTPYIWAADSWATAWPVYTGTSCRRDSATGCLRRSRSRR